MTEERWQQVYRRLLGDGAFGKLEKFMAVVEAIRKRPYLKVERRTLPTLTFENLPNGGSRTTATDYDHGDIEELRSVLLSVRPLLLKNDPTFMPGIIGLLVRCDNESERVEFIKAQQRLLREARRLVAFYTIPPGTVFPVPLDENGVPMLEPGRTYEDLLEATLYRSLFHWQDSDGKPEPPDLNVTNYSADTVPEVMKRGMLIMALYHEASFACWLSDFVKTKGTWPEKGT